MIYKIIFLFLFTFSNVFAGKILFGLFYNKNLRQLRVNSSIIIFKDGQFVFESNTGEFGLCLKNSKAGKFKGRLTSKELDQMKSYFKEVQKSCNGSCKYNSKSSTWVLNDFSTGKKYGFSSDRLPNLISYILNEQSNFKATALSSVLINYDGDRVELKYQGTESLSIQVSPDNFLLMEKSGAIVSARKSNLLVKHFHDELISFGKSRKVKRLKLFKDNKKLKEKYKAIIYNNNNDVHHVEGGYYLNPCFNL